MQSGQSSSEQRDATPPPAAAVAAAAAAATTVTTTAVAVATYYDELQEKEEPASKAEVVEGKEYAEEGPKEPVLTTTASTMATTLATTTTNALHNSGHEQREPSCRDNPPWSTTFNPPAPLLEVGDHVYRTSSFLGIPGVTLHHAIVLDLWWERVEVDAEVESAVDEIDSNSKRSDDVAATEGRWMLQLFDYTAWGPQRRTTLDGGGDTTTNALFRNVRVVSSSSAGSCVRRYESDLALAQWRRVEYGVSHSLFSKEHWTTRSGTHTSAPTGPSGLIKARADFLWSNPQMLPPPTGALGGPGECAAVWTKTGSWETLQSASWLGVTAAGQVKSTATLAGVASTTQVTVPAAGLVRTLAKMDDTGIGCECIAPVCWKTHTSLGTCHQWGWFGYTTQVPFLSLHPYVAPAIAAYGVVTVGAPLLVLWSTKRRWKDRTAQLHQAFWDWALEDPQRFAECCLPTNNEGGTKSCRVDAPWPPPLHRGPPELAKSRSFPGLWTEALPEEQHRIRWNSV